MRTIDFKTSAYFPKSIIFLGFIFTLVGVFILIQGQVAGIPVLLCCLLIFTTHYRLRVDLDNKIFSDYVWILGFKHGRKEKFDQLEYLFIKKGMVSQTMSLRVASTTIRKEVYDGYLKFSDTKKIHLLSNDSKSDLVKRLQKISVMLDVRIKDYTVDAQ
jgi:uncharacterized protein YqfA (UPF0365 family)